MAFGTTVGPGPVRCTVARVEPVNVPPELLWDDREPPDDPLWRLQRIAEWSPAFGRDRTTVAQLYAHRNDLRIPSEVSSLIEIYEEVWREREAEPWASASRRSHSSTNASASRIS